MTLSQPEQARFLQALDTDPQFLAEVRNRVLTPELVQLPERFAELVRIVTDLSAQFEAFAAETKRRLTNLETDVATLKSDVATLKGSDLERRVRDNILNIARDELDLTRGRILLARSRDTAPQFIESIEDAEERGLITEEQADHVLVADIIIRARRVSDKRQVYGVFEVSQTINRSDVQRAHDRAATVAAATGDEAIAAVIGVNVGPVQQRQAAQMGVRVLMPAMLRSEPADEPG